MTDTLQDLTNDILTELTAADGQDVQTYLQPRIYRKVQRVFNRFFYRRFWADFTSVQTYTLDGTTGKITTDVSALIKSYKDIDYVWLEQYRNPLPEAPGDVNPSLITQYSITPSAVAATHGFFNVLPVTATGAITIKFRTKPADFVSTDTIPMDTDYLLCKVVAEILSEDGTNMTAASRFMKDADAIMAQLNMLEDAKEKSMYSASTTNVENWNTR